MIRIQRQEEEAKSVEEGSKRQRPEEFMVVEALSGVVSQGDGGGVRVEESCESLGEGAGGETEILAPLNISSLT